MTKHWYMQFDVGKWLSDSELSSCLPATRGIWMDLLCRMHNLDRCGQVVGTCEQLARQCRCTPAEMSIAIEDIKHTNTAEVHERDGVWTIICRCMRAEYNARKNKKLRNDRFRKGETGDADETPPETEKKPVITNYGSDSGFVSPDLGEVKTEGQMRGIAPECCEAFFNAHEACGWIDRAQRPIRNWRPLLRNWAVNWRANQHRSNGNGEKNGAVQKPNDVRIVMESKQRRVKELERLYATEAPTGEMVWSDAEKRKEWSQEKKAIKELDATLRGMVGK